MVNIYLYEGVAGYDGRMDVCRLAICSDMVGMENGVRYPGNVKRGLRLLMCRCVCLWRVTFPVCLSIGCGLGNGS